MLRCGSALTLLRLDQSWMCDVLQEFVKAVESWRKRDEDGHGAPAATSTAQSVADRLAKDLEADRQASSLKLKQQREDAERRLREVRLFSVLLTH
jgi:hypothetical protein